LFNFFGDSCKYVGCVDLLWRVERMIYWIGGEDDILDWDWNWVRRRGEKERMMEEEERLDNPPRVPQ